MSAARSRTRRWSSTPSTRMAGRPPAWTVTNGLSRVLRTPSARSGSTGSRTTGAAAAGGGRRWSSPAPVRRCSARSRRRPGEAARRPADEEGAPGGAPGGARGGAIGSGQRRAGLVGQGARALVAVRGVLRHAARDHDVEPGRDRRPASRTGGAAAGAGGRGPARRTPGRGTRAARSAARAARRRARRRRRGGRPATRADAPGRSTRWCRGRAPSRRRPAGRARAAIPKSVSIAKSGRSGRGAASSTLDGLTSRCTRPRRCAASRAAATCPTIATARSAAGGPVWMSSSARSGPSTSCMSRNSRSSISP